MSPLLPNFISVLTFNSQFYVYILFTFGFIWLESDFGSAPVKWLTVQHRQTEEMLPDLTGVCGRDGSGTTLTVLNTYFSDYGAGSVIICAHDTSPIRVNRPAASVLKSRDSGDTRVTLTWWISSGLSNWLPSVHFTDIGIWWSIFTTFPHYTHVFCRPEL